MGFFSKSSATPSFASLAPISVERVKADLDKKEVTYFLDDDGDLTSLWDHCAIYFLFGGEKNEILRIHARWHATLSQDRLAEAVQFCNNWNVQTLWPKTFAVANNDDRVVVLAELNVDYEHGVSDEQLGLNISCAMSTILQFFEKVTEEFPEEWSVFEAERKAQN